MKRIIKNNRKKLKPLLIFMIGFVFTVLILNTAFSLMSSTLLLSGEAAFRPNKDVRITEVSVEEYTAGASETYKYNYSKDSLITGVELENLSSTITYRVRVANNGNVDVKLSDIVTVNNNNSTYMTYSVSGIAVDDVIPATQDDEFFVTFAYKSGVASVPENNVIESRIKFNFEEVIPDDDNYVETGLIFDLEGTSESPAGTWEDLSSNGNDLRLQNITYNSYRKGYDFSGSSSCGFFDESLIPTTGNFSMDVTFTLGTDASTDQAIATQKTIGTKDAGRFKPFNINAGVVRTWGYLTSADGTGDMSGSFGTATASYTYTLTVVREGSNIRQYLNGVLVNTIALADNQAVSSGTTQIGCFDGASSQNFKGIIHSMRLYNGILTQEQIEQNNTYNHSVYYQSNTGSTYKLLSYIENNSVLSGAGVIYRQDRNKYYYQGSLVDNYIKVGGDYFRIISYELGDDTLQVFKDKEFGPIAFDASGNRTTANNPYCTSASSFISGSTTVYNGCNAFRAFNNFANGNVTGDVTEDSTLKTYLNTTVYNSFNSTIKSKIIDHNFNVGGVTTDTYVSRDAGYLESDDFIWNGKVGTFNAADVRYTQDSDLRFEVAPTGSYIASFGTSTKQYWTMNASASNTFDSVIISNKKLTKRRSSRDSYSPAVYYVFPVIFINGDITVSGTGSFADPFIIQ